MGRMHTEKDLHKEYYKLLKKISSCCSEAILHSVTYEVTVHNKNWPANEINESEMVFGFENQATLAISILNRILDASVELRSKMLRFYKYTSDDVDTLNSLIFELRNAIYECCITINNINPESESKIFHWLCSIAACAQEYISKAKNASVGYYPLVSVTTQIAEFDS